MENNAINEQLKKLKEPFPPGDIEWRVMRSMPWGQNVRCLVYPYVTARAIHQRFDDVVGPANWCNTPQQVTAVDHNTKNGQPILSIQVGISVRIDGSWVTKYNVSEPTDVEAAKGGFSGAEKRAGEEWGVGRYLWLLGEMDADTQKEEPQRNTGWHYGRLGDKYDNQVFYWKPPRLPAWALPSEGDSPVSQAELNAVKKRWVSKFAPKEQNRSIKVERFTQFVVSMFGQFPVDDPEGWTQEMVSRAIKRIEETRDVNGPSVDVPFG